MHFSVLEAHTGNSTLRVRNSEARSGGQSNTRASSQLSARNEFVVPDLTGLTYQHSGPVGPSGAKARSRQGGRTGTQPDRLRLALLLGPASINRQFLHPIAHSSHKRAIDLPPGKDLSPKLTNFLKTEGGLKIPTGFLSSASGKQPGKAAASTLTSQVGADFSAAAVGPSPNPKAPGRAVPVAGCSCPGWPQIQSESSCAWY